MWRKSLGAMWREWGLPRGACSFAAIEVPSKLGLQHCKELAQTFARAAEQADALASDYQKIADNQEIAARGCASGNASSEFVIERELKSSRG